MGVCFLGSRGLIIFGGFLFFQKMAYVIILCPLRGWHLVTAESRFLLESRLVKSCMHLASLSTAHIPLPTPLHSNKIYIVKYLCHRREGKKKKKAFSYFQNRLNVLEWKTWVPRKMTEQEDWFSLNTVLAVTILALCTVSNLSNGGF